MSEATGGHDVDLAPGEEREGVGTPGHGVAGYLIGLVLAALLTAAAFLLPTLGLVWPPSIPVALAVLAVAQMGVHLVFFLHITTGPDNTNNVMALAFGVLVVLLIIGGSVWIMSSFNSTMMRM